MTHKFHPYRLLPFSPSIRLSHHHRGIIDVTAWLVVKILGVLARLGIALLFGCGRRPPPYSYRHEPRVSAQHSLCFC
ncbi:hypothetical protein BU26DRAFT_348652 [Trematosphaeria pertusa]|uniref:Uncharacterized protein n=1 Tax=Trematosphaeria pertusa TaxID=390896 RepID=A0A6A6IBP5_9PLEO|nr:uncharacterized protein BU26DRAFT_348652 [Trematosphaeria pertusa]KAF2247488.1 hypothetical protein BU26DRAFT_348652 [Trematosphaeria pertusa]